MLNKSEYEMTKFEINKTYKMHWIGDSNLFSFYKVTKRTEKTVYLTEINNGEKVSCRIKTSPDEEFVYPTGKYSMCPILRASRKV